MSGPIVITGFMGCGKTEVARELARRLAREMVDLDERIAEHEGRTAAQIIIADGEPAFRLIETNALRELLSGGAAGVIALGGGAWISEQNRELIARSECSSWWLDAPFEVCWKRIEAAGEERPLGRTRAQAEELYRRRRPIYQLANFHVAIMGHENVGSVVAQIMAKLET